MGIFSKKVKPKKEQFTQLVDGFANVFSLFGKDKLNSDIFNTAVQTNATHRGKLKLVHMLKDVEKADYKTILQLRPNPAMNITDFLETLSINYDTFNNAFGYIERNEEGKIVGLWAINPGNMQIGLSPQNNILCRFTYQNNEYTVPYSRIIHIKKTVTKNEIFGDDTSPINQILNIINTNYQGIENAIKTSGLLKFIIQFQDQMSKEQLRSEQKKFIKEILDPFKAGGVKALDSTMKIEQLDLTKQRYSNFAEQKLYATQVYNFLGVNEKIISGTNTDNEMISYYERSVDSFALKLSQELTYKFFNDNELSYGNKIIARDDRLAFMSIDKRIEIARLAREVGILKKGDFADLLYLPIDNEIRDELMAVSQNYQGGENKNGGNKDGEPKNEPDNE